MQFSVKGFWIPAVQTLIPCRDLEFMKKEESFKKTRGTVNLKSMRKRYKHGFFKKVVAFFSDLCYIIKMTVSMDRSVI